MSYSIHTYFNQKLFQMKDIFSSIELKKLHLNNLDSNEWAYKFIFFDFILIIPCRIILENFYMNNKTIKDALLKGNIEYLYSKYEFIPSLEDKYFNKYEFPQICDIYNRRGGFSIKIDTYNHIDIPTLQYIANLLFDYRLLFLFKYHYIQIAITKNKSNLNLLKSYLPFFGFNDLDGLETTISYQDLQEKRVLTKISTEQAQYSKLLFYTKPSFKGKVSYKKPHNHSMISINNSYDSTIQDNADFLENYILENIHIIKVSINKYAINIEPKIFLSQEYLKDAYLYTYQFSYFVFEINNKIQLVIIFGDGNIKNKLWHITFKDTYNTNNFEYILNEFLRTIVEITPTIKELTNLFYNDLDEDIKSFTIPYKFFYYQKDRYYTLSSIMLMIIIGKWHAVKFIYQKIIDYDHKELTIKELQKLSITKEQYSHIYNSLYR